MLACKYHLILPDVLSCNAVASRTLLSWMPVSTLSARRGIPILQQRELIFHSSAGGILTFKSFQNDFGYRASLQTEVNSLTVGLQQLGAFLACPLIYPIADKFGRRNAIMLSAAVFLVGAILQTINTGSLAAWYVARIVAGFGMGGYTVVTPVFSAEMAPKQIRGRMGSCYQMMYTIGIFTAYWVNYVEQPQLSPRDVPTN